MIEVTENYANVVLPRLVRDLSPNQFVLENLVKFRLSVWRDYKTLGELKPADSYRIETAGSLTLFVFGRNNLGWAVKTAAVLEERLKTKVRVELYRE